jgi:hypothetical protein
MQIPKMGQTRNTDDCRKNQRSDKKTVTVRLQIERIQAGLGVHLEKLSLAASPERDKQEDSRAWGPRRAQRTLGVSGKWSRSPDLWAVPGARQRELIFQGSGVEERPCGPTVTR